MYYTTVYTMSYYMELTSETSMMPCDSFRGAGTEQAAPPGRGGEKRGERRTREGAKYYNII